jgi:dipeptidyl aminopeptidase/acylaminoacyl peptidase
MHRGCGRTASWRWALPAAAALALLPSPPRAAEAAREGGAPRAPLTAESMWGLARLAAPAISPDGAWAVVPVTRFDVAQDRGLTDLWLVRADGTESRQLTSHEGPENAPAWSPDGRWIAFVGKRGEDAAPQVYAIPVAGGEARRVTNVPTGAAAPRWFPDSRRIAFVTAVWADLATFEAQGARLEERRKSKVTARVFDRSPARIWDRFHDGREHHVYVASLDGGAPAPVTFGSGRSLPPSEFGVSADDYDVSPDGAELAFAADVDATGVEPRLDVFAIPVAGGTPRNLTPDNPAADDEKPAYSPDGSRIAFGRQVRPRFWAEQHALAVHDRATGANRVLTAAWDRTAWPAVWTPDGAGFVASIDDAGTRRLHRIDAATGAPAPVTKARSFASPALARDGRTLVALREAFDEPPTLVRVDLATGEARKLSTFNDEALAKVALGRYESVTVPGWDGRPIQTWVVYPPGFDPSRRYPVYVLIHGGPHVGVTDSFHWRWNAQVFAGWGYVTAWPNFHGSSGFGQAFVDSIDPDWATKPAADVLGAARWLARQPWADGARMAAGGGSYGGYLASLLLGRAHPFRTLVVHAGVYDRYAQLASDYGAVKGRNPPYWEDERNHRKVSPHLFAARFSTPTLVVHGALDYRVPETHAFALWHTLQQRGVRSRLVHYPDENHWILKPQNSIHWYAATRDWLAEIMGKPEAQEPVAQFE